MTTQASSVARQEAVAIEQRVVFCVGLDVVSRRVAFAFDELAMTP